MSVKLQPVPSPDAPDLARPDGGELGSLPAIAAASGGPRGEKPPRFLMASIGLSG